MRLEWRRRYKARCRDDVDYSNLQYQDGNGVATGQSYRDTRALNKVFIAANAYVRINGQWEVLGFGEKVNFPALGNAFQVMFNRGY